MILRIFKECDKHIADYFQDLFQIPDNEHMVKLQSGQTFYH